MTTPTYDGDADVIVDGQRVGHVWWSMNEETLVNVEIDPAVLPLVHEWAAKLEGEFSLDPNTPE